MHILITGGAGFIGSNLTDRALAAGHTVTCVDDLSTGHARNLEHLHAEAAAEVVELDISRDDLTPAFAGKTPHAVVHLAAQISVRESVAEPQRDAEINILGTIRLLHAMQAHGVDRIVLASSGGCIYGQPALEELPVAEEQAVDPHSPYGASKLSAEFYLRAYAHLHGIAWTALAFANVYGPRQDPAGEAGVVAIFTRRMLAGQPCTIFGDGEQTRDFVYVDDVVDSIMRGLHSGDGQRINIGTGIRTSVNELFARLATATGYTHAASHGPARDGELAHISLDPSGAADLLGWQPATDLDAGLARTIDWARRVPD